ncbi:MAG TPA: hypothetical protein VM843_05255 [Flavisolibacter sp.]|nr:hypothetical protein [Flavisolibacter sp.]
MIKFYSLLIFLLCGLVSCKTASKAYDKGDYANAIELAIKKLQKDPQDGETKALLKNAYRFALDIHEDKIRILNNSSSDTRFEQIYFEYRTLQNFYTKLQSLPSLSSYIHPTDYSASLETYRTKAAEVYEEKAIALMDKGSKEDYRRAHTAFKQALIYKPGDKELEERRDEAYQLALVNIVVLPLEQHTTGYNYSNASNLRSFETDLVRNLRNQNSSQYLRFYTAWEAENKDLDPDEVLELRLGRMDIGRPYDHTQSRSVSKEVVVKETVYKPDSVVKQMAKVTAQVITTRRTLLSEGSLFVTSRDSKGRVLWQDQLKGSHKWQVEFATYRGDERALSDSDRSLLNQQVAQNSPHDDEIIERVLTQIENELKSRVHYQYSRYY